MKNTLKRTMIAALLGTTALLGSAAAANAAVIESHDQAFTMETPNENWKEIDDQTTVMTLTNGNDFVTVKSFDKEEALKDLNNVLPMPTVAHDEFEEEVLTYYSTANDVYVITGLSESKDGIDDVRFIVNSIQLKDHIKQAPKAEEKKEEKKDNEIVKIPDEMYTVYNELCQPVILYKYTDGNFRNEDGTLFQHVDDGEWVDYYGNHYTSNGTSASAEKTGVSFNLVNEAGHAVTVYEYSDGSLRSDDSNVFQYIDDSEYIDYYGNHYLIECGNHAGDDAEDVYVDSENQIDTDTDLNTDAAYTFDFEG